ncbi:Hsp70 family protein [Saccharopolyspora sp. MS10]|uniref:Hsp70 family protein n=1 Tax=Saccharopolyspora sp. MS10 TaxID=3385973 RepID=UPI0039A396F9
MRVLSVDLGTSNTVAVLSAHGRPPRVVEVDGSATMPSAVFATEDGAIVVGRDAERRARLDPSRFEPNPKRRIDEGTLLLGDAIITVTDAMAAVLHRVAEETTRQLGGAQPDEVRLTHPAQWGPTRRTVLLSAARLAGFRGELVLIPEPVAAAAHFASFPGRALPPGGVLAVYDLGAGTFDCAVVGATPGGFAVLAEDGLADLGGLDVDQALLEHVGRQVSNKDPQRWQALLRPGTTADRRAQRALREDVREAKEVLSRHVQTEVPMPEPFADVLVTRQELEALIRPSLRRSVEMLAALLRAGGMGPQQLAGLYLVGGSSRLPLVASLIGEELGIVPTSLDQPETAVALGAHHVARDGGAARTDRSGFAPPTPPGGYPPPAFPVPPPAPGRTSRRPLVLGGALAAALVLVAAVVLAGALGGGGAAPGAAECRDVSARDAEGFTPCLRALAGDLPERAHCAPGWQRPVPGLRDLGGVVVSCAEGNPDDAALVIYAHLDSVEAARERAELLLMFHGAAGGEVRAAWSGGGLTGRYRAVVGESVGTAVFTADDLPVVGAVLTPNGDHRLTPDGVADEFERLVQPGAA